MVSGQKCPFRLAGACPNIDSRPINACYCWEAVRCVTPVTSSGVWDSMASVKVGMLCYPKATKHRKEQYNSSTGYKTDRRRVLTRNRCVSNLKDCTCKEGRMEASRSAEWRTMQLRRGLEDGD